MHLGLVALIPGTVWTASWAMARLGWLDAPWAVDTTAELAAVLAEHGRPVPEEPA